ncbi:MAG: VOC family protein [Nitrososphaerota archaeon]|jgi:predicted enzyme related to lactoylglutathione lyase|nr:VOC family protein [Nitrososphaerota archaeon]MDG6967701.1 VOC family protein [Nitrososphaerota archaeon]MDG6978186.1 VOC family protein [Nitrososphaerota archaeon]MDG7021162.1 VOC family protein [Nitrososphaerota archaeon]
MTELIRGLYAVSIHIRDARKARAFYGDVLGLKELQYDEKASRAVFALPGTSATLVMHVMRPGEEGREPGTVSGVIFSNPDPAAACAEIKKRGGKVTMEPTVVEMPGARFVRAAFADPDGNEFLITDRTG